MIFKVTLAIERPWFVSTFSPENVQWVEKDWSSQHGNPDQRVPSFEAVNQVIQMCDVIMECQACFQKLVRVLSCTSKTGLLQRRWLECLGPAVQERNHSQTLNLTH